MVVRRAALLLLLLLPVLRAAGQGVALPFFDDFSSTQGAPRADLWVATGASVGPGSGELPPTVGLATLDALGPDGLLYPHASADGFGADTLGSQPVDLGGWTAADSLVLSFFFLPGGGSGNVWERTGDAPEAADSLCLDFYAPAQGVWRTVWRHEGLTVDTLLRRTGTRWQYVALAVDDTAWLHPGFRFRLRNRCSLDAAALSGMVGNCDMWHIDYVLLDAHRTALAPPAFTDVAFAAPAASLLEAYTAMPAHHYSPAFMRSQLRTVITNLDSVTLSSHYTYLIADSTGRVLHSYDGGLENVPPHLPGEAYQQSPVHAEPPLDYALPLLSGPATFTVTHVVHLGMNADDRPANDTVRFHQRFGDHFAYDDGTPEDGFGMASASATMRLAYRFDLGVADTLTAIDLFFNPTHEGANLAVPFRLMVWQAGSGGAPGTLLYADATVRHIAPEGVGRYHRYALEEGVAVQGSIFVGFEQDNSNYINLGFDRSNNTSDRIYTRTGSSWERSFLSGSLMMRPVVPVRRTLSARRAESPAPALRPNPANGGVEVRLAEGEPFTVVDCHGRTVATGRGPQRLATAAWPQGIYLVRTATGAATKLIITH